MKIFSMGDGLFDDAKADLEDKPCVVLLCDSRDELSAALKDIGLLEEVTIVRATPGNGAAGRTLHTEGETMTVDQALETINTTLVMGFARGGDEVKFWLDGTAGHSADAGHLTAADCHALAEAFAVLAGEIARAK